MLENVKSELINKRFLLILFSGVLAGTLFANFFGVKHISDWGIFDSSYMVKYSSTTFDYSKLWKYVAESRIGNILFLILISLTAINIFIFLGYLFYIGLGMGLIMSMAVMQYGGLGVWIYILSIFPQYLFYGLALYLIAKNMQNNHYKHAKSKFILAVIVVFLLVLVGICMESFVNPMIMKRIIYNIY